MIIANEITVNFLRSFSFNDLSVQFMQFAKFLKKKRLMETFLVERFPNILQQFSYRLYFVSKRRTDSLMKQAINSFRN